jgi:hypothetical protein
MFETDKRYLDDLLEQFHTFKEEMLQEFIEAGKIQQDELTFDRGYAFGVGICSISLLKYMIETLIREESSAWALIESMKMAKAVHEMSHLLNLEGIECEDLDNTMEKLENFTKTKGNEIR